jgi:hypothetical protein
LSERTSASKIRRFPRWLCYVLPEIVCLRIPTTTMSLLSLLLNFTISLQPTTIGSLCLSVLQMPELDLSSSFRTFFRKPESTRLPEPLLPLHHGVMRLDNRISGLYVEETKWSVFRPTSCNVSSLRSSPLTRRSKIE